MSDGFQEYKQVRMKRIAADSESEQHEQNKTQTPPSDALTTSCQNKSPKDPSRKHLFSPVHNLN